MKKLVIILVVLVIVGAIVGGLAYADTRVRSMAESHAEEKIVETLPQASGVHVTLDGFPFTPGVLMSGEVDALHVAIDSLEEQGLQAHDLTLHVEDIRLDEDALIDDHRLVVTDIGTATATAFFTDDEVSAVVGKTVEFSVGSVHATYKGHRVQAQASVEGRKVRLSTRIPGAPQLVFPLPPSDVLPCAPELELLDGKVRIECSIDEIPPRLRQAMANQ